MSTSAKNLELDIGKEDMDHDLVQKVYESGEDNFKNFLKQGSCVKYLKRDVELLRQIHYKLRLLFSSLGLDYDKSITLPNMVEKYWKKLVKNRNELDKNEEEIKFIPVKDSKLDEEIRKTIAGRVQGKIGDSIGDFVLLDIVSLYPSVMREEKYPYGEECIVSKDEAEKVLSDKNLLSRFWVNIQQNKVLLGSRKKDGRLDWSDNALNQKNLFLNSVMINYLREEGCLVEIIGDGVVWKATDECYKEYVDTFVNLKILEDEKIKRGCGSKSYRTILKLCLNSLSGKPLQKHFKKQTRMWKQGSKSLKEFIKEDGRKLVNWHMISPRVCYLDFESEDWYKQARPSQLGDFIYTYARVKMNKLLFSKYEILYTDTDSAVVRREVYEDLIKRGVIGDNLGMLKLELEFDRIIILAPKVYVCIKDGKVIKKCIKGVRDTDTWSVKEDGIYIPLEGNIIEFFESMLKHGKCYVKTWNYFNDVSNIQIVRRDPIKEIKMSDFTEIGLLCDNI